MADTPVPCTQSTDANDVTTKQPLPQTTSESMWRDVFAKSKVWWPKHQTKEALQYQCPCVAISIVYMKQEILRSQAVNELTNERLRNRLAFCSCLLGF